MVAANSALELALPWCNHLVQRLSSRCKVVGLIKSLFVTVYMYLWQPLIIQCHPLARFFLCLPGPVTVKVKVVMIPSSSLPGLTVFTTLRGGIKVFSYY